MFKYATNHPVKKASLTIKNKQDFDTLNLSAKLARKDLFEEILKIRNIVSFIFSLIYFLMNISNKQNLCLNCRNLRILLISRFLFM